MARAAIQVLSRAQNRKNINNASDRGYPSRQRVSLPPKNRFFPLIPGPPGYFKFHAIACTLSGPVFMNINTFYRFLLCSGPGYLKALKAHIQFGKLPVHCPQISAKLLTYVIGCWAKTKITSEWALQVLYKLHFLTIANQWWYSSE